MLAGALSTLLEKGEDEQPPSVGLRFAGPSLDDGLGEIALSEDALDMRPTTFLDGVSWGCASKQASCSLEVEEGVECVEATTESANTDD